MRPTPRTAFPVRLALSAVAACAALLLLTPPASAAATLDNLQAAFNGESNAHARYTAFAQKADAEGYAQVASLFRAAARAESIHADNHAEVIRKLGGTPNAKLENPEVKSTKENLEAALAGESYERDTMYPEFLAAAKTDRNKDALRTFNLALQAESEHAKLYRAALDDLEDWRSGSREFWVCTVCGYTTTKLDFQKCPACFNPKDRYVKVG